MALIEANWQPTNRQLRQFGVTCLIGLPLIAWLWSAPLSVVGWLAFAGAVISATTWLLPRLAIPLFVGLMLVTLPIGIVVGEVVMLAIYYVVFLPIGFLFKLMRRDRLQLCKAPAEGSYWQPKAQPRSVASYYHQS